MHHEIRIFGYISLVANFALCLSFRLEYSFSVSQLFVEYIDISIRVKCLDLLLLF